MKLYSLLSILILPLLIISLSCSKKTPPPQPLALSEANQKLIDVCKKDYELDIKLFPFSNSIWIYFPSKENIFELKVLEKKETDENLPNKSSSKKTILFADGKFINQNFEIEYDIDQTRNYSQDYGYKYDYTEKFQIIQRDIITSIHQIYSDSVDNAPAIVIVVIADIKNGIETKTTLAIDDIKRAYGDATFQEEYMKRSVMDYPKGDPKIVDDTEGKYLALHDVSWGEFLAKQMVYRIRYKYESSSFPPSDDTKAEVLNIIAQTVQDYKFEDFNAAVLKDLSTGISSQIGKNQL